MGDGAGDDTTVASETSAGVGSLESRAEGEDGRFKKTVSESSNVSEDAWFRALFAPDENSASLPDVERASDDLDRPPGAVYLGGSEAILPPRWSD